MYSRRRTMIDWDSLVATTPVSVKVTKSSANRWHKRWRTVWQFGSSSRIFSTEHSFPSSSRSRKARDNGSWTNRRNIDLVHLSWSCWTNGAVSAWLAYGISLILWSLGTVPLTKIFLRIRRGQVVSDCGNCGALEQELSQSWKYVFCMLSWYFVSPDM